ncbi:MAG: hypothetical protein AAF725_10045 [Acidobacteriota bacterium]
MPAATAARLMAEGRAAVLVDSVGCALPEKQPVSPAETPADSREPALGPQADSNSQDPGAHPAASQEIHLFTLSRAILAAQTASGRRRLHRFEAQSDVCLAGDLRPMAELLLRLGCASRSLPPPKGRDTLVLFRERSDVAGVRVTPGSIAAIDFDPLSVLPELRGLHLYPWDVMPIDQLGTAGCQGEALEFVRVVLELEHSWHPLRTSGFLGGVFVDATYRDYRRQMPAGRVIRAYATHGDMRPPHAVLLAHLESPGR